MDVEKKDVDWIDKRSPRKVDDDMKNWRNKRLRKQDTIYRFNLEKEVKLTEEETKNLS